MTADFRVVPSGGQGPEGVDLLGVDEGHTGRRKKNVFPRYRSLLHHTPTATETSPTDGFHIEMRRPSVGGRFDSVGKAVRSVT